MSLEDVSLKVQEYEDYDDFARLGVREDAWNFCATLLNRDDLEKLKEMIDETLEELNDE